MTSVEKRRSGRKNGGHRKHSNGAFSDASSSGSFLDETDREVSNLTDRAFRSLCIGDEAVYNDSDLCSSSPCSQRDWQRAFSQSGQERDKEDREREELKRAAHESFSLRMQQYGQDWIHGGMYGAQVHRDPQWEVHGERTQVSATFQHSFVETSQQEESLRNKQLSFLSNGAKELSLQQRRSRSRVSSLIQAFNSEGYTDGAGMDGKLREWNDETVWDKSALMSIQRDLSEFSTSYQQNLNSGDFPSAGPFLSHDTNLYSSEIAAVAHINSESSFMRASHSKHSMSTQVNCNSNFFIHSEFSPFKVWKDHNRFPFQQGEVSGFLHCSEFSKWYETPMYKKLSLETQTQGPYRFEERGIRHPRNNLAPVVPPIPSRSTSTSTMPQKALAVEKRCESELAGHYPHRKRTQSLGTNKLPSQRPSTASPTIEMSRRVQDTISSVKALQQKIKMMTEQNITTSMPANKQDVLCSNNNLIPFGNNIKTVVPNVVSSDTSTTPFNISQPLVHAHQEADTSEIRQYAVSPQPVEHPPVRAESRGTTPDVRMSSYKSRATSLLFNLKDNRKRVKSTYSPTKFKGLETLEKNEQHSIQEPRDTVIDIPDFPDPDIQFPQVEESSRTNAVSHQYVNKYHSPGFSLTTPNSQPATAHRGQYSEYTSDHCQPAQIQGEMVHHSGFTGFIPENCTHNQLANGQNLHEDLSSFTPYKQGMIDNVETLGGDIYRLKPATETPRLNSHNNQTREYLISKANAEQHFNETVGREFTKDEHAQAYQKAAAIKDELNLPRDKYRGERIFVDGTSSYKNAGSVNPNISNQLPQYAPFSNNSVENPAYYGQQQCGVFEDKHLLQKYSRYNKENEMKDNYLTKNYYRFDHEFGNQQNFDSNKDKTILTQETGQRKSIPKGNEMQSLQPIEAKLQFGHNMLKESLSSPDNTSAHTMANRVEHRQFVEVKAEQARAEHTKAQHTQVELAKPQNRAQVEQPKAESDRLILAEQTGSEKVKAEQTKVELAGHERVNQEKTQHIKDKKIKEDQAEQSREKQPDQAREEQTKTEQTRVQKVTEEPKNITEETGVKHMREVQVEHVRADQAEAQRLKEEHIKTELVNTKQTRITQVKSEQVRREKIKAEQVDEERVRDEDLDREQIRTEKVKAEQAEAKTKQAKEQKTKVVDDNLNQGGQVNPEQPATQISNAHEEKAEDRKAEQDKLEQTNVELAKAELENTENMQERSAKPAAKVTVTQQVKSEPDKVEQVKTELAKAKAELAKIKEKIRVEQKEKVRNATPTKEDGIKKDVPLRVNINKNEERKYPDQATQKYQQRQDSVVVSRQSINQANRGADDYDHLGEKYGFTDTTSINRKKLSAEGNDSSNDDNETQALSLDKVETTNDEKSEDKHSPENSFSTATRENKENVGSFKSREYVYSESSKEFKLSSDDYLPTNVDIANSDDHTDKVKDDSVEKLEKCDPLKHTDVSQQRNLDLAKPLPLERKPKSTEHSVGPDNDLHLTPPRALSHKERAQTKQEILTSKIKAHAEKEISAIKERGFAIRDGLSKTFAKQLAGSQRPEAQRPPSREMSNKHESTMSSNTIPKHQMGPSGKQIELVKSVSPPSSATIPVKSAATNSQLFDHSQKQIPKEPMISNAKVPKPPREAKQTGTDNMSTDEGFGENQKKEKMSGIKSPMQSEEQAPENKQGNQEGNHGEIPGKQRERLKDNPAFKTDHLNKKKEDSIQATVLLEAESSKPITTEKAWRKHEAANEDSAPSLKLVFGQNETPVADDSLQIMGIMVTVRERKPSVSDGQKNDSAQEQINAKEKECSNTELDKCQPSSGLEVSKENGSSKEVSRVKAKARDEQNTHPTVKEDQTKVGMNNHAENVQETSAQEIRQNIVPENVTVKWTNHQQVSSSRNARPQRETQLQEPLAEKGVPSPVTVPAKNKVLAENESTGKDEVQSNTEERNSQKRQTALANENFMAKMVNTGINYTNDSNRVHAETLIKHDTQSSMKEDMTMVINPSKSRSIDGKDSPLLEEKRHDSTPPKPFNKTSPYNHLTENESIRVSPKHQYKETHIGENKQVEDNVHIGGIAIRVVPATEKDNLKIVGKHYVTPVPSDVAAANEHKQVATSSPEEKENTLNNEDRTKDLTPASSEKEMKDSFDDKLGYALSSVKKTPDSLKISNQQKTINTTSENTRAENGKPESVSNTRKSVGESEIQPMEGDYFQVQGVVETNNKPHNSGNVGDTSAVSKGRDLPRLNKAAINNESNNEGKNEVFALAQGKMKTVESSSVSVEDESEERKSGETQGNLVFKQSDSPTERQSNKNDKTDAGQSIHITKQHTENQSSLSARERHTSINPLSTRENMVKEKPEVKPKPKERVSTIPEISAIADYARLKVIVSEDQANTIQEFPPNKKEGFFPLIQTRHSRRPVYTADPQNLSVKEKHLPNKTEVSPKVNKEPKPLIFPITEKEHQRTGMFKLGDKERQEKMLLDAKANEYGLDSGTKHAQHPKERNKSPTNYLKNQGSEEQATGTNNQRVHQVDQSIHQTNIPPFQATTSSSEVNRPRSTVVSQLKHIDNSYPHEKPDEFASKAEKMPHLDQNSHPQPILRQVYNIEESKQTTLKKDDETENVLDKIGKERLEKLRQERVSTRHEETTAKQNRAKHLEEEQASRIEVENRTEDMKIKQMIEENRACLAEEVRRSAQREEERRAREREAIATQIKQRREKQREAERRAEEERKAKQTEEERVTQKGEMRIKQQEAVKTMKETEEKRRIKTEEERRAKLREEEEQKIKNEGRRRRVKQQQEERAAQEEQQRRAAQEEEQQRRAAQEEQQRRAALKEEQQRRAAQEEQQRRAAQKEEQQRRAAQKEEQQRRAAQEEQQRRAAQEEEQQRRAAQEEEQQRRAAQKEEQQRRAAQEEKQQRRAAQQEQQRRAAQEQEQQRIAAREEEQQMRAAQEEEQQRRAAQEEQQRRAAQEKEQQRRAAQEEEQQMRAAQEEEQQRRAAQEEQQRRAAQEEEQQRRAAQEEQQRRAAQEEEQQRGAAQKEQQRGAAQEEQHRRTALIVEQRRAKQKILVDTEEENKRNQREEEIDAQISEERIKQNQMKAEHQIEEQKGERQNREVWMRIQREEEERTAVQKELTIIKQRQEKQAKEERTRILEESQAALKEEKRVARERMLAQREDEIRAKKREEEKEKLAAYRRKESVARMEEQKKAAQMMDALQYYTIASTESERKPRERQLYSPLPFPRRNNSSALESTEDSHTRLYRPHAPSSPALSLPRSNTSSPALGTKPSMFRVKDNTIRGSSFIKSVKPRFHKNFGEDFRVGSPMGSERGEEEQDTMRPSVVTPLHLDTGLNRLTAIKESSTFQPAYSSQDYSARLPHHRPYSRKSIALDEDDSRSVISNMSEDVESFATSAADLADVRGLYDFERPESSCSFSSDVCRSLGKPPTVPPKSDKALRRAKRLTTRRIKKELSKAVVDGAAGVEKPLQEVSSIPSSSATEVRSSSRRAVATPHFSPPVSLTHAPKLGSSLPSSHTEHQSSHSSFYASPHATGPISLPTASPHETASVSLPVASPHPTGPASHAAAPKTMADVPSSPTLHHASHPAPVTKYHVESSYPHSYPLTQRKVLQDLGSGQYFVVDMPVQVKTKTFFDPETGKYVQLNVRESAKRTSQPQHQQTYLQPQLQPQINVKPQQQPLSQDSTAGKPLVLYQGYHGYPQSYQPAGINSVPHNRSSAPVTLHQDQQPVRESHSYGYPATEMGQNSEGHYYGPEKTPYMDTVNDIDKTYNTVYNPHGPYESFPECDTNSQLAGSSVYENDNSAHSQQPRDIITISELEDFMELSDW